MCLLYQCQSLNIDPTTTLPKHEKNIHHAWNQIRKKVTFEMEYLRKGFILKLFMVSVLPTGFYNSSDTYGQRKLNTVMPFLWTFYPLNQKKN